MVGWSASVGFYRDNRLAAINNRNGPKLERIRKDVTELLKKEGLSIIIERNFYKADSLNINLAANKYFYFRKVNDTPLYINALSPHLPTIIKQLPQIISKRNSDYLVMRKSSTKLNLSIKHLLKDSGNFHQCLLRGHPYSTYAQRVRGGFNPNAYN